ncbi:hypothetical protein HID58_095074 [Brassica napus]|uniref:MADS-box domain-containing protein n=1 Tax=Brassica napus TaxID=3708 RepID=A0ABQ7X7A5_BRANA|nr:hypothetical protein HID58_095074 [Brassica napus]
MKPMTNSAAMNQTFRKRKKGLLKKANELSTLYGVKVCAVINSCDSTEPPEFWPSKEGAEAVHSAFMGVLPEERCKRMYDQERHLEERIQKGQDRVMRLHTENREIELTEVMFDLLKGKTLMPDQYGDPSFMRDLNLFIGDYVKNISHRIEFLEANGEPVPPNVAATDASGPVVGDANPFVVETEGLDKYTGLNHDQGQSSNQYPNSNQSFMSLLMGQPQQMSDVEEPARVASMGDNNNGYHQLLVTSQMPSTTTTTTTTTAAATDLSGHRINNGWPTRFGLD